MADENCAHPGCKCKAEHGTGVSQGEDHYCSSYCANSGSSSTGKCECGHSECR